MDCSPPGSSVHGIFQVGILEWVAISFFRGASKPTDQIVFPGWQDGWWILYHCATWEVERELQSEGKASTKAVNKVWSRTERRPVVREKPGGDQNTQGRGKEFGLEAGCEKLPDLGCILEVEPN